MSETPDPWAAPKQRLQIIPDHSPPQMCFIVSDHNDPERRALEVGVASLNLLDAETANRVARYLAERFALKETDR